MESLPHRVVLKVDTLDQENRRFDQVPLREPVFLNSIPKSGSHLLRNIIRMFVPVSQQYQRQFIQHAILAEHAHVFSSPLPMLSWGHLASTSAMNRSPSAMEASRTSAIETPSQTSSAASSAASAITGGVPTRMRSMPCPER